MLLLILSLLGEGKMNKRDTLSVSLTLILVLSLFALATPAAAYLVPSIGVEKKVLDPDTGEWVEKIGAGISDIVRFRCEIHNTDGNMSLTDIVVTDTLPESLEYAGSATVHYPDCTTIPQEPIEVEGSTYVWEFPALLLEPGESITIEFDAHVVDCGVDTNLVEVEALAGYFDVHDDLDNEVNKLIDGEVVYDEDMATVVVPCPPRVPTLSQWGMIITASFFTVLLVWMVRRRLVSAGNR